jgi:hypothetical protein
MKIFWSNLKVAIFIFGDEYLNRYWRLCSGPLAVRKEGKTKGPWNGNKEA